MENETKSPGWLIKAGDGFTGERSARGCKGSVTRCFHLPWRRRAFALVKSNAAATNLTARLIRFGAAARSPN